MEADLLAHYNTDITLVGVSYSWRRLASLIRHLPRTSATYIAVEGEQGTWATADYLLAQVIDLLAAANWQRAGQKNLPRPKPFPRPNVAQVTKASADLLAERLLEQRTRLGR